MAPTLGRTMSRAMTDAELLPLRLAEFEARVAKEIGRLPSDMVGFSRSALLTRYLVARQLDVDRAMKARIAALPRREAVTRCGGAPAGRWR